MCDDCNNYILVDFVNEKEKIAIESRKWLNRVLSDEELEEIIGKITEISLRWLITGGLKKSYKENRDDILEKKTSICIQYQYTRRLVVIFKVRNFHQRYREWITRAIRVSKLSIKVRKRP